MTTESGALPGLACNEQIRIVPREYMFDYRETQADAAVIPAAPAVHPEEPLRQARNMFFSNPLAGVFDNEVGPVRAGSPAHGYGSARVFPSGTVPA